MTLQIDAVDGIAVVHDTTALVSILTTGIGRERLTAVVYFLSAL